MRFAAASTAIFIALFSLNAIAGESRDMVWIDGDDDFTKANGVRSGKGTQEDPFIISDWTVNAEGRFFGVAILQTTKHFVVERVTVVNAFNEGIYIGAVAANTARISDCTLWLNRLSGIKAFYSPGIEISGVSVLFNGVGITIDRTVGARLDDVASGYNDTGIYVSNSEECTINKSTIYGSDVGLAVNNGNADIGSTTIRSNDSGAFLDYSHENSFENCEFVDNGTGLQLLTSSNNRIVGCEFTRQSGMAIEDNPNGYGGNNLIYLNNFIDNRNNYTPIQMYSDNSWTGPAYCPRPGGGWTIMIIGNYWSSHEEDCSSSWSICGYTICSQGFFDGGANDTRPSKIPL